MEYEETDEWKYIAEYPRYMISCDGVVYDTKGERVLVSYIDGGYPGVSLRVAPNKNCTRYIHRLLAQTFIPNPQNLPVVDHINRDKTDYSLENLRWVTQRKNALNRAKSIVRGNSISQYSLDGVEIATFRSYAEAARKNGLSADLISYACRTPPHIYADYQWMPTTNISLEGEEWKPLNMPPIHLTVEISNMGRLRRGKKIYQPHKTPKGYLSITFDQTDGTRKTYQVHRLVARAFLGESDLQVNHKNKKKDDNRVENLEYVTASENMRHARANGQGKNTSRITSKAVLHIDEDGNVLQRFPNIRAAAQALDCSTSGVTKVCHGLACSIKGSYVKFEDENRKAIVGNSSTCKPVEQLDINGCILARYKGARHASIETAVNVSSISDACLGKKKTAGGFVWRYSE